MFNNKIKTVKATTLILGVAMCLTGCKTLDEKTANSKNEIQAQTLAASRLGNQIVRDPKQAPRRYPQTQGSDSSAVKEMIFLSPAQVFALAVQSHLKMRQGVRLIMIYSRQCVTEKTRNSSETFQPSKINKISKRLCSVYAV